MHHHCKMLILFCALYLQGADLSQHSPEVGQAIEALRAEAQSLKAEHERRWRLPEQQAAPMVKVCNSAFCCGFIKRYFCAEAQSLKAEHERRWFLPEQQAAPMVKVSMISLVFLPMVKVSMISLVFLCNRRFCIPCWSTEGGGD